MNEGGWKGEGRGRGHGRWTMDDGVGGERAGSRRGGGKKLEETG